MLPACLNAARVATRTRGMLAAAPAVASSLRPALSQQKKPASQNRATMLQLLATISGQRATPINVAQQQADTYTYGSDQAGEQYSGGYDDQGQGMTSLQPVRFRNGFAVYKGKLGALRVKLIPPTWAPVKNPKTPTNVPEVLDRDGTFLLEFAHAAGEMRYDWEKKQSIALSAVELGAVVEFPDEAHEFFHDPQKGNASYAGKVSKVLKWSASTKGPGYFLNLTVTDKSDASPLKVTYGIPISLGELAVLRILAHRYIPTMLGFEDFYG